MRKRPGSGIYPAQFSTWPVLIGAHCTINQLGKYGIQACTQICKKRFTAAVMRFFYK